jgi:hypothetical protein
LNDSHLIPTQEHHEITINAPAELVFEVTRNSDMQSIPIVRAIFWLRAKLRGATIPAVKPRIGLVAGVMGLGWGCDHRAILEHYTNRIVPKWGCVLRARPGWLGPALPNCESQ